MKFRKNAGIAMIAAPAPQVRLFLPSITGTEHGGPPP